METTTVTGLFRPSTMLCTGTSMMLLRAA